MRAPGEVAQAMGQLEQELGRNATETEVAERLGIPSAAEYRQMLPIPTTANFSLTMSGGGLHGDSIELASKNINRKTRYNNAGG